MILLPSLVLEFILVHCYFLCWEFSSFLAGYPNHSSVYFVWTEAAWNDKFSQLFYKWPALELNPRLFVQHLSTQPHASRPLGLEAVALSTQPCAYRIFTLLCAWAYKWMWASNQIWAHWKLTLKVLVATIDAQWEGMGDVGSARYEPALLPPCPAIRVLSYSN